MRRAPPQAPPRPKGFEIRKGRSGQDESDLDLDQAGSIEAVSLPQSITQAEEEESLKKRFGVEELPEIAHVHDMVRLTESGGVEGPDRKPAKIALLAFILLLVGGAALLILAKQNGMLDKWLQGQ